MSTPARIVLCLAATLGVSACSQPGIQAPPRQAAALDVATSRISVACGYVEELGAYGPAQPASRNQVESIAVSGARKLAAVYARDQTGIYQGESVGAIVNDSIDLLRICGLPRAQGVLQRALRRGH
jgi:hypothetical protein